MLETLGYVFGEAGRTLYESRRHTLNIPRYESKVDWHTVLVILLYQKNKIKISNIPIPR